MNAHIQRIAVVNINRFPDARWLVINGEFSQPVVSLRNEPLSGRQDKVEEFSEVGGLVIPTPVLFRYWRDVKMNVSRPEDVMDKITSSNGVLKYSTIPAPVLSDELESTVHG